MSNNLTKVYPKPSGHDADAFVVRCIDFRCQGKADGSYAKGATTMIADYVRNTLGVEQYDNYSAAGAAKSFNDGPEFAIQNVWYNLEISRKLHNIQKVILINHTDCGAYGGSIRFADQEKEIAFHTAELRSGFRKIKERMPDVEVVGVLAIMHESSVEFREVSSVIEMTATE
jgi:hypothetical protein